jgi:spermidine/putrescine transport system permease protein
MTEPTSHNGDRSSSVVPASVVPASVVPASVVPASVSLSPVVPSSVVPSRSVRTGNVPGSIPRVAALPALFIVGVLLGGPLIIVLLYSFLNRGKLGVGVSWKFTLIPYRTFVFREDFRGKVKFTGSNLRILWYSIRLALVTTISCLTLAIPAALWISQRSPRKRNLYVLAITIPFWTNVLVRTYAWILILNDKGLINKGLIGVGLINKPLRLLYTSLATQIGLIYTFLPFMVLPVYSAMERFDVRLAEAAFDLGAKRSTVVRRIIIPTIKPGLVAGSILVFVPALGSFLQPDLLGGGRKLMVSNLIQQQFGASRNYPYGSALAFILFALVLVVLIAVSTFTRKRAVRIELI